LIFSKENYFVPMKLLHALLLSLSLFVLTSASAQLDPDFYLGGIQVNEADYGRWTSTIKAAKMNTVEVTVYAKQGDWDSDTFWWEKEEAGVIAEIRAAKKANLKVVLILRVALDHAYERNKFLWHGMILAKDQKTLDSWFTKYSLFTLKWAKIAKEEKVEVLSIGSELNALSATFQLDDYPAIVSYYASNKKQSIWEKRALKFETELTAENLWVRGFDNYQTLENYIDDRVKTNQVWANQVAFNMEAGSLEKMNLRRKSIKAHWERIIASTRKIYKGQLTYSANFDNYQDVAFWKSLDYIGINAYFPLRDVSQKNLSDAAMKAVFKENWGKVFDDINAFKASNKLYSPLFFTELGYIYRSNCSIEPWKGFGFSVVGKLGREELIVWKNQEMDTRERALAVNALYEVVYGRNEPLKGILYWKLTSHDYHIPVEPFVLHIAAEPTDELQTALARFTKHLN